MKFLTDILAVEIMSTEAKFILKALGGMLAGFLIAHGVLDQTNSTAFINGLVDLGGAILTIVSYFFILYHAYQKEMHFLRNGQTQGSTFNLFAFIKSLFVKNDPVQTEPSVPEVPAT